MSIYKYDNNSTLRSVIRTIVNIILVICTAWFIVYSFLNQTIVSGNSMSPVLEANDMCLVNRLIYDLGKPGRYDIILFERNDTGKTNIKRVVGLPGESVQISAGLIYINGEPLKDERIGVIALSGLAGNSVELGDDEYFVIGDNSDSSEDSRFSNIGNVRKSAIRGKIWLRIKPFNKFGTIK